VEFVRKYANDIRQQETYQEASSMPPLNLFDPSLMIEDFEVFMESQDVQACDPTTNYLSNPSNQSLIIEGISISLTYKVAQHVTKIWNMFCVLFGEN